MRVLLFMDSVYGSVVSRREIETNLKTDRKYAENEGKLFRLRITVLVPSFFFNFYDWSVTCGLIHENNYTFRYAHSWREVKPTSSFSCSMSSVISFVETLVGKPLFL